MYTEKCSVVNFSRKIYPTVPFYLLNNKVLPVGSEIRDLGLYLDNRLSFVAHHNYVLCSANIVLGCIKRYGGDFGNYNTLKLLYVSLVRSHYVTHIGRLEAVQRRFINFI